jgi:ATP-dependent helicase HrpA
MILLSLTRFLPASCHYPEQIPCSATKSKPKAVLQPQKESRIVAASLQPSRRLNPLNPTRIMRIHYPAELPITARKDEIVRAIQANQVVVVAGDTGSGKTTQLPKMCLEAGRGAERRLIGCTQPRRIAAMSVAERVQEELGAAELVGYKIRFSDRTTAQTKIKFMTDGVLLAETQSDRTLRRYDTLIIDEAHERSLNIDFLLGYLHRLLADRPDLKLLISSATIDTEKFSRHFGDARPYAVSTFSTSTNLLP